MYYWGTRGEDYMNMYTSPMASNHDHDYVSYATYVRVLHFSSVINMRDLDLALRHVVVLVDIVGQQQRLCSQQSWSDRSLCVS